MARSARARIASGSSLRPSSVTPMLPVIATSRPSSSTIGAASAASSRSATDAGRVGVGQPLAQHRELVAAEAGHQVAGPQGPAEPIADHLQHVVAGEVPDARR